MSATVIKRVDGNDDAIGRFIHEGFTRYSAENDVALRYDDFCFASVDGDGKIIGVIIGHAYYNEVHIRDLIIDGAYRRPGIGSRLVAAVEKEYGTEGYEFVTLTTFGFQAPDFYRKLGYEAEFIRRNTDPKLSKYFFKKTL